MHAGFVCSRDGDVARVSVYVSQGEASSHVQSNHTSTTVVISCMYVTDAISTPSTTVVISC
jgi:hypothetical protein